MANWYDTFDGTADCCTAAEYDKMTDFIQTDAVAIWHLWDTVTKDTEHLRMYNGGGETIISTVVADEHLRLEVADGKSIYMWDDDELMFRFYESTSENVIKGGSADHGMYIFVNNTDNFPRFRLIHEGNIDIDSYADVVMKEQGTQMFKFTWDGTDKSYIMGSDGATDDVVIQANSAAALNGYIGIYGQGTITLASHTDINFYEQGEQMFEFQLNGDTSYMYGSDDAGDKVHIGAVDGTSTYLFLEDDAGAQIVAEGNIILNSSMGAGGHISLNSESDIFMKESGTQMFKFALAGDDAQIYGPGTADDDLVLFANSSDTYPQLGLYGAAEIKLYAKTDIIFYDETAQMFKFVLENSGGAMHIAQATDAPTPIADSGCLFVEDDNTLRYINPDGTEYTVDITAV